MKKAIIGLYRHNHRTEESTLIKRIESDVPLKELIRKKGWKKGIEEKAKEEGFEVSSISVAHSQVDLDINIVVTVDQKPPGFGEKRKATTRGGQPMDGPVKTGKTMAAKKRAARETPRR